MKSARVNNVFMTRHKNPYSFYKTEIQLHVLTNIFKHIAVRYSTRLVDVQVYDGPGPLSPIVSTYANSTFRTAVLTSFQGYIKYLKLLCTFNCEISLLKESELSWSSIDITISRHFKDCVQHANVSTFFRTATGYCHPQRFHGYIAIHQLRFSGFDTLYDGGYHASCHYGGLFIVFYSGKTAEYQKRTARYFTLCSNITSYKIFQFMAFEGSLSMLILFNTYKGYSSGFVDITIPVERDCHGKNFLFSKFSESGICNRYERSYIEWNDNMGSIHTKNSVTHCVDIWLLHNIISFDSGRSSFLNCSFYLENFHVVEM